MLSPAVQRLYRRSLLVTRTQINHNGAVIAANDSDVLQFGRDTYSYMWPRDGALTAAALDFAGYGELSQRFFDFCGRIISDKGCFLHKYNPDGSLGSSWHPWYGDHQMQLPIQEDETALVLWALWRHFQRWGDVESLKPLSRPLIVTAAANFAALFGEEDQAARYRTVAATVRTGMATHLFVKEANRFARRRTETEVDLTVDASLCGAFAFGAFGVCDPMVQAAQHVDKAKEIRHGWERMYASTGTITTHV